MRRFWTEADIKTLTELYPVSTSEEVARILGRTARAIYDQASVRGIKKSAAFMSSERSGRITSERGKETRFKKGLVPWNTGKKHPGRGNSIKTQFKPGSKPQTWVPVGSERLTKEGIRQRKLTDTGCTPKDWHAIHALLWAEHYGPVPAGSVVIFRNGNREDIRIENLELVTRAELMRRNSIQRYPKEIKDALRTAGKLRRTIKQLENSQ